MEFAQTLAQKAKTPLLHASTEALNQGSCWRRIGGTNYQLLNRLNTGDKVYQITFYAISLRHWLANRRIHQAELDTPVIES